MPPGRRHFLLRTFIAASVLTAPPAWARSVHTRSALGGTPARRAPARHAAPRPATSRHTQPRQAPARHLPAPVPMRRDKPLVMLDPGHGGKDPGCIGLRGTQEKRIVLATALELRRQLLATGRYRVGMTRATDIFIPLAERVALAQQHRAALFMSIHANASLDHAARGLSVYTFAYGASDPRSAAAAQRENSADPGKARRGLSPQVDRILSSLMRRETRSHSAILQHEVVRQVDARLPTLDPAGRHARFAVLRAPDIASVLVETGFLTNPADEALLAQASHRRMLATALSQAVEAYVAGAERQAEFYG